KERGELVFQIRWGGKSEDGDVPEVVDAEAVDGEVGGWVGEDGVLDGAIGAAGGLFTGKAHGLPIGRKLPLALATRARFAPRAIAFGHSKTWAPAPRRKSRVRRVTWA